MKNVLKFMTVLGLWMGIYAPLGGNARAEEPLIIKIRTTRGTSADHDPTKEYKYQLLQLIFNKTQQSDGPFRIEPQPDWITQARSIDMVKKGYLKVTTQHVK